MARTKRGRFMGQSDTEPGIKRREIEAGIQRAFFQAVKMFAPDNVLIFSIPNEGNRGKIQTSKMKAIGLMPGAADVVSIWSGGGMFIEFKGPDGRQSKSQAEFQRRAGLVGWPYVICRDWKSAWNALADAGAPMERKP